MISIGRRRHGSVRDIEYRQASLWSVAKDCDCAASSGLGHVLVDEITFTKQVMLGRLVLTSLDRSLSGSFVI